MGLRAMLFAIGLGALWGGGRTGLGKLPDSINATAEFSPNGREIYVLRPPRLYGWDLKAGRIARERNLPQAEAGIAFSAGGTFMVLAVKVAVDPHTSISLIRTRDGETVFARVLPDPPGAADPWYTQQTRDMLAATDDGRWLAAWRVDTRELEIVSIADGRTVLRKPLEPYFQKLAFNPRGNRLFAATEAGEKQTALVLALSGDKWENAATLEGARHPAWSARGLAFATSRGIEIWDGAKARLAVPKEPPFHPQADGIDPRWRVSPDGGLCIFWDKAAFAVRETASGGLIVAREVDTKGLPAVLASAFVSKGVRALLATGELVDVDVAARSIARRASFGRSGRYSRNLFQDGATWSARYSASLSRTGRYLVLRRPNKEAEIYLTE